MARGTTTKEAWLSLAGHARRKAEVAKYGLAWGRAGISLYFVS